MCVISCSFGIWVLPNLLEFPLQVSNNLSYRVLSKQNNAISEGTQNAILRRREKNTKYWYKTTAIHLQTITLQVTNYT